MKRGYVLTIGMLGATTALVVAALILSLDGRVSRENFRRLKLGMTDANVEAILGPALESRKLPAGSPWIYINLDGPGLLLYPVSEKTWKRSSMTITVTFVEGGTVGYASLEHKHNTWFQELRSRLNPAAFTDEEMAQP
jgi:hypothetical protein